MQTLEQPPGDLEPSCAALARVCCMTLIKFLCLAAPHSTCEMKTIISPFSHILLGLFNFSCQLLQEEAVHLVLLLPGSEHTVPHISLCSPVMSSFPARSEQLISKTLPGKGRVFQRFASSKVIVWETEQMPSFQILRRKLPQCEIQPTTKTSL